MRILEDRQILHRHGEDEESQRDDHRRDAGFGPLRNSSDDRSRSSMPVMLTFRRLVTNPSRVEQEARYSPVAVQSHPPERQNGQRNNQRQQQLQPTGSRLHSWGAEYVAELPAMEVVFKTQQRVNPQRHIQRPAQFHDDRQLQAAVQRPANSARTRRWSSPGPPQLPK